MINLKSDLENFLKSNHNAKNFIDNNKILISNKIKNYYDIDISEISCTEIRYLILNYPFNLKCLCEKIRVGEKINIMIHVAIKNVEKIKRKNLF